VERCGRSVNDELRLRDCLAFPLALADTSRTVGGVTSSIQKRNVNPAAGARAVSNTMS
jgi:hypothetical protein